MDSKMIRARAILPKPLLLKDYLLDDMSSCSSNGFKSFPRRQCCTTVRFVRHEFDRKNSKQQQKQYSMKFNKAASTKSALSALQSVITAVKRLPFKSPEKKKSSSSNSFLPRSFSKRIFKKSNFWKRSKADEKEIVRWKSFHQLLKDDSQPSDRSDSSSKSYSWSGSDFTVASGNYSSSEVNLNLADQRNDVVEKAVEVADSDNGVGVTNGVVWTDHSSTSSDRSGDANSSTNTKKQWSREEKEQFSPVSVLDCPFDDEDEVSSPFQHRLARMEGTKKKLLKKIQRFECLAKLEPVNLTRRFALQLDSDNESSGSPLPYSSASTDEKFVSDIEEEEEEEEEEENEQEEKALELLNQMKASVPSHGLELKADKLLLGFFRERIASECANSEKQWGESSSHEGLLEEAKDWIYGRKHHESFMEWEANKNRQAYVKEMEKGEWKTLDEENKEVALELENEVFAALLSELLLDILS